MLRLKEVVDKQRDEIRAQTQEILCKTRDTEALQEQLNRFMAMNEELRRKLAVVQAQLKSALQKKDEAERALLEARQEARRSAAPRGPVEPSEAGPWVEGASGSSESPPSRAHKGSPFPQEELRQILTERNELKTSLFLVQEELAYYQRELLNDERIPGILLDAVRSTIKKQRKKIRAKMLGTAEEPVSSEEEEEEGAWLAAPLGATDCPDSRLPESRIKSFPPSALTCCPGWEQEGHQCLLPLCTGPDACRQDEVCVRPGLCRCRPGFFGFNCLGRCPDQYWGPDCKETCLCHPNGKCDPASGRCSCHPGWWGPLCQAACPCGPHGRCSPLTGACRCEPGWWAPDCARPCSCNLAGSRCDPLTGRCLCHPGWWGRRCASFCSCGGSPCAQETGRCECRPGLWGVACQHRCQCLHGSCAPQHGECTCHAGYRGPSCADPCPAGTYGLQCLHSCGHCRHSEACSPVDGACLACDPGWNGTHCQQPCPPGRHGENCTQACPHCLQEEACHPVTGECQSCDAGLTGARCELPCPEGSFGFGCRSSCPTCFNGSCDPVSGACMCQAGFWGHSCNQTCPEGFHGPNCSETCRCLGAACHPLSGECQWRGQTQGALLAGILTPLLFFLLIFLCCCCCRRSGSTDAATDRAGAAPAEGDPVSRVKHHTLGALAGLTSAWPCFSFGGYRFPRVTVSHHDVELPFSPSFIEAPSAAWPSDSFSSFDTEDEDEELPPASQAPGDTELQPRRLLTTGEDPPPDVEGFAIPRTSSLAKAKRPSVSFAEGTRFSPQGLLLGPAETLGPTRRPKGPQAGRAPDSSPEQPPRIGDSPETPESAVTAVEDSPEPCYENVEAAGGSTGVPCKASPRSTPRGSQKRVGGSRHVAQRVEDLQAASAAHGQGPTTIYVTVGRAGTSSRGPVQAALRRLGSLHRPRAPPREEPQPKRSLQGLRKPPRRRRTARPPEQGGPEALGTEHNPPGTLESPPGLLEGRPALPREEEEEEEEEEEAREEPGVEAAQSFWPPEKGSGGEASAEKPKEEDQEPKYENVSAWQGCSPSPP